MFFNSTYEKKENRERNDEITLSKDRLKYLSDTGVIKILAVRKVRREERDGRRSAER